jgi:hypothetical protein
MTVKGWVVLQEFEIVRTHVASETRRMPRSLDVASDIVVYRKSVSSDWEMKLYRMY